MFLCFSSDLLKVKDVIDIDFRKPGNKPWENHGNGMKWKSGNFLDSPMEHEVILMDFKSTGWWMVTCFFLVT